MARPNKQAMDYFAMDTKFDDKTVLYLLETEAVGLAVLVTAWQLIYGNMGYFAINGEDFGLLVKQRISVDINRVNECINSCLRRDLFSQEMHERYGILTSRGIQKRYFEVGKVRKAVEFIPEFMLLDVSEYKNLVNVNINSINGLEKYTKESKGNRKETKEKNPPIPPFKKGSDKHKNSKYPSKAEIGEEEIRIAEELFEVMNQRAGMNFKAKHPNGDPTAHVKFVAFLLRKGYTKEQMRKVAIVQHAVWSERRDGHEFVQDYYRPETLFNETKFMGYVAKLPQVPQAKPDNEPGTIYTSSRPSVVFPHDSPFSPSFQPEENQ